MPLCTLGYPKKVFLGFVLLHTLPLLKEVNTLLFISKILLTWYQNTLSFAIKVNRFVSYFMLVLYQSIPKILKLPFALHRIPIDLTTIIQRHFKLHGPSVIFA